MRRQRYQSRRCLPDTFSLPTIKHQKIAFFKHKLMLLRFIMKNRFTHYIYSLSILAAVSIFAPLQSQALDPSHYAANSALAQGRWVKVRVTSSGMYRISAQKLKSMGFTDASKVNIYGYGGRMISENLTATQPDDLPMQQIVRQDDGSIIFYAAGTVSETINNEGVLAHSQNPYSTAGYYYLSDCEPQSQAPEKLTPPAASGKPITEIPVMVFHEKELEAAGDTGRELLGEDFRSITSQSFSLDLPGRVADTPVEITIQMAAKSAKGINKYSFTANGTAIGDLSIDGLSGSYSDTHQRLGVFDKEIELEGDKLDLNISYTQSGTQVVYLSRLDYIRARYTRSLDMSDGTLTFAHYGADASLRIVGADVTSQVWDITNPAAPVILDVTPSADGTIEFGTLSGAHFYIAFTPEKVTQELTSSTLVTNQDIHGMATPDMLIITPSQYATQARKIATLHSEHDGLDVVILTPEQIYEEFSSGSSDVSAFRKLLKMWYDRDPEKIKYCLLFGRATYDNRLLTTTLKASSYPRIPIWQSPNCNTETSSYCSDNYIGMIDDNPNFSMGSARVRVAIGRMPIKSSSEAAMAVEKLTSHINTTDLGSWRNQVMVIADDADYGDHLKQAQACIAAMQSKGNGEDFIYERLYLDSYPLGTESTSKSYPDARKRMLKLWNDGVSFIDFIGHGNPTSLTHENLLTFTDITTMSNSRLPIMIAATCEFMRFDSDAVSAAEHLWLNPSGGTIAFIAANRKVYISTNGDFNKALSNNLYLRDADGKARRLGDVYIGGLNDYPGTDDNRHRYALMGDPAMRITSSEYHIEVDEIDGVALASLTDAADYPTVNARSKVNVKGRVTDADGNTLTDFNGKLIPTVFDAERVIETYGHSSLGEDDGKVMMYNDRKNRLFTGTFTVTDGEWEATLVIPEEIDNNYSPALLNLYAYADDYREANGSTEKFYIYGFADDSDNPDTIGPEIIAIGLNSYMFKDGSVVNASPLFVAKVRDESGINISSSGIGKQMTLIVDGRRIYEDLVDQFTPDIDDYLAGEVQYTIPTLDDGKHTAQFIVWDNAGNSSSRTLNFEVDADKKPSVNVYTDATPATTGVTFYITPDLPSEGLHSHVAVYDLSGRMIWDGQGEDSGNPAMPLKTYWNLTDRGGARVPRGIYIYRCTVSDSEGKETTIAKKIAVAAQ